MHSSRMRTARSLTVCRGCSICHACPPPTMRAPPAMHTPHAGGVCMAGGACMGGVHGRGHVWQGHAWWGACMADTTAMAYGHMVHAPLPHMPTLCHAYPLPYMPPQHTHTRTLLKILPCPNFVAGGKNFRRG